MSPVPVLVALADPIRCRIVEMLRAEAQPVHRIAAAFPVSRPAISRHLKVLKRAKLISEKKVGRENIYVLHTKRLEPVRKWLEAIHPVSAPVRHEAPVEKAAPRARAGRKPVVEVQTSLLEENAVGINLQPAPAPQAKIQQMGFDF